MNGENGRFPAGTGRLPAVAAWLVGLVGLWLRLQEFGRYGFWNDEAWVALTTRVVELEQFWLALGPTPIGWAAVLQLFAWLPGPPEVMLRLLPLLFSLLTLWAAWATASSLAGGLGGLLAVAVMAFEPISVAYAKTLKAYSAETFVALLALYATIRFARTRATRDLVALALVLGLGLLFSNAQLFLAPPLFAAALIVTVWRRDWPSARRLAIVTAVVGVWDTALFAMVLRPRMLAALVEYWTNSYVPTDSFSVAAGFVGSSLVELAGPAGTLLTLAVVGGVLVALIVLVPSARVAVLGLGLLFAELVALSALRRVPLNEPRVMLFFSTLLLVVGAASIALVVTRLASRRRLLPVAFGILLLLFWDITRDGSAWAWRGLVTVEDLGPLVRKLEASRHPGDRILLYGRSRYVYAYYQAPTPVLVPNTDTTVGFEPLPPEGVVPIEFANADEQVVRALDEARRVWFVGSRSRGTEAPQIVVLLSTRARVFVRDALMNAWLVGVARKKR